MKAGEGIVLGKHAVPADATKIEPNDDIFKYVIDSFGLGEIRAHKLYQRRIGSALYCYIFDDGAIVYLWKIN